MSALATRIRFAWPAFREGTPEPTSLWSQYRTAMRDEWKERGLIARLRNAWRAFWAPKADMSSQMWWWADRGWEHSRMRLAHMEAARQEAHPEDWEARVEVERLRSKIKNLKREITNKNDSLHHKNLALDAMHYVWCDGGCAGGVHRYEETWEAEGKYPTREVVDEAVRNTTRLVRWFATFKYREGEESGVSAGPELVFLREFNIAQRIAERDDQYGGVEKAWKHLVERMERYDD